MRRRIRDLDFDAIVTRILQATDVANRRGCDYIRQADLDRIESPTDAVTILRAYVAYAAAYSVSSPEELRFDQPIVEAFVRVHHHPLSPSTLAPILVGNVPDVTPKLLEIAAAHPDAKFGLSTVKDLLIRAILVYGDDELDDAVLPWQMYWNRASPAASALIQLVTLQAVGDIVISYDEVEKAEFDEAVEHFKRTRKIKPLKLD